MDMGRAPGALHSRRGVPRGVGGEEGEEGGMNPLKRILEAEEQARRICSEAEEEARRIQEEARSEASSILEEARRRGEEVGRRAMEEAEARARAHREETLREAEEEISRLRRRFGQRKEDVISWVLGKLLGER